MIRPSPSACRTSSMSSAAAAVRYELNRGPRLLRARRERDPVRRTAVLEVGAIKRPRASGAAHVDHHHVAPPKERAEQPDEGANGPRARVSGPALHREDRSARGLVALGSGKHHKPDPGLAERGVLALERDPDLAAPKGLRRRAGLAAVEIADGQRRGGRCGLLFIAPASAAGDEHERNERQQADGQHTEIRSPRAHRIDRFATPRRRAQAGAAESSWLARIIPSGSQRRLTSARREQVSSGRIASTSHGRSAKLK